MNEQIKILIEHGDEALNREDTETALEFYKGAVELGSTEAAERINKMTTPESKTVSQSIITKSPINQPKQLKEQYASLEGLKLFLILGVVIIFGIGLLALFAKQWLIGIGIIFVGIINCAFLGVLDVVSSLVNKVNELEKKSNK